MTSLRQRLTLSLAASLALFFVLQTLMIGEQVQSLSEHNLLSHLQRDQEQVLAALEWNPPAGPTLRRSLISGVYERPFSGHYFQIDIAGKSLRSRSLWDEQLAPISQPMARDIKGPEGQRLLIIQNVVRLNGQPVTIRMAEDILPIKLTTETFQRRLLLSAIVAVALLILLQGWLIGRSLNPLQRIQRQINRLKKGELEEIDAPAPDEIMPLVEEVNHLMHLMHQRLQRSRHALGDLAHSLKTPLAIARQIVARQPNSTDNSQLKEQLERIEQRIERELVRARTAGRMPGGQWGNPEQDIRDLVKMIGQVSPHIAFTLQLDEKLRILADREDMLEIFGNLLENASKWAASRVRCSVSCESGKTSICIEDDGPGIEQNKVAQLLFRGEKADESRPGHGLGLSIVSEMVAAYEGSIDLSRSPDLHGLKVSIVLP